MNKFSRIRRRTPKRAKQERQYNRRVKEWLVGKACIVSMIGHSRLLPDWNTRKKLPATQCHHQRGRIGELLLDERFWLPVSAAGHRWINDHPHEARRHGLLCEKGQWNMKPIDYAEIQVPL